MNLGRSAELAERAAVVSVEVRGVEHFERINGFVATSDFIVQPTSTKLDNLLNGKAHKLLIPWTSPDEYFMAEE